MSCFIRKDILTEQDAIEEWIRDGKSKASICRNLHCKQETLNKYLEMMGISYHGNKSGKNAKKSRKKDYMQLDDYLKECARPSTSRIREKLIREGYKKSECECCGLSEWLGEPIPLELHHIDGDKRNNRIENYQILCPNCHAKTDSYRGKNIKSCKKMIS